MAQQMPHYDQAFQPFGVSPGEPKPIESVTVQTSALSLADGQMSPFATPGYNPADPFLPAYGDLATPPSSPKRISRKPVGGGTIKSQAQAQFKAASASNTSEIPLHPPSSMIRDVPTYTSASPTSDVPAYSPTSLVTDVPQYESLTQPHSPPSSPSTVQSPVFSPISATSTASTVQSPVFSPITPTSTSTTIPPTVGPPAQGAGTYLPLTKPIVIPQVLNHTPHQDVIGKPFIRAYAEILAQYSISQEAFLAFLDKLNMDYIGHVGFDYTRTAGKVISLAGSFDPTGITKLVGSSMSLSADLGKIAYIKGPMSKKKWYLNHANDDIFKPRGLKASIMSGKELRQLLGVDPKFPLCAPLMTGWVVPNKEQLLKGQRAMCRVAARQIQQLLPYVHDVVLAREANDTLLTDSNLATRKAAKSVRDWQVGSEVQHELWRGQALALYAAAKSAATQKEKQKLEKKAKSMDKEPIHTEKISWLVICNADGMESAAVAPNRAATV